MPTIRVKENEPFEVAMRRFKRAIEKTGLLTELRAREAYEKPTTERKRKKTPAQPTTAAENVLSRNAYPFSKKNTASVCGVFCFIMPAFRFEQGN